MYDQPRQDAYDVSLIDRIKLVDYQQFYQHFGMKQYTSLAKAKTYTLDAFRLPKQTILHYVPRDELEIGISQRESMLNVDNVDTFVFHHEKLIEDMGKPRKTAQMNKDIRKYHKQNRQLRHLKRLEQGIRNPKVNIIINYAHLQHSYRYTRSNLSHYYMWHNLRLTAWRNMMKMAKEMGHRQVLLISMPEILPDIQAFYQSAKGLSLQNLKDFTSTEALDLLNLWYWGTNANVAYPMKGLDEEQADQIDLIFLSAGRWNIVTLTELWQWKKEKGQGGDHSLFAKHLYAFFEKMHEIKTVNHTTDLAEPEDTPTIDVPKTNVYLNDRTATIKAQCDDLAQIGALSRAEYNRMLRLGNKYKTLKAPDGKQTLEDLLTVSDKELAVDEVKIPDIDGVLDKSMLGSTLTEFDNQYIDNVMEKDIAGMVMMAQNVGVAVTGYERKRVVDAAGKYDDYAIQLTPVNGSPSTIHVKIPVIEKDGTFKADGVKARLAKQRGDIPIRKVSPRRVALTSYYGKVFVDRSDKRVNDFSGWAVRKIIDYGLDNEDTSVTDLQLAKSFDYKSKVPSLYSGIASRIRAFTCNYGQMYWYHEQRQSHFGDSVCKALERNGHVVCGKRGKQYITVDPSNVFYLHKDKSSEVIGDISKLLNKDMGKRPVDMAEVKIFDKMLPVGILLGHELGLKKLLKVVDGKTRTVLKGTRADLNDDEVAIVFQDQSLIFSVNDRETAMILSGFNAYKLQIKDVDMHQFDRKDVYFNVLEKAGVGLRYVREFDVIYRLFVDPITERILKQMDEPQSFEGLLLRSVEMLVTDEHPDETDTEYMRIKGYERISGFIYKELCNGIRSYRINPSSSKAKISVNPMAVWINIIQDPSVKLLNEINPIENIKQKELVTYSGEGGRSSKTMVKSTRVYHPNDMGVISESTVESGAIGINTYTSANPNLVDLRGTTRRFDPKTDKGAKLLSTSANLFPAPNKDDPKRALMISVQNTHMVACKGYQVSPLSTGYEMVLAHRTDPMFAYAAPADGKVIERSDTHMLIELNDKDKSRVGITLGTLHGSAAGLYTPQRITTDYTKGQRFKRGHILAWNTGFFERDFYEPTQVNWKMGRIVTTAMIETPDTLEDSSAISENLTQKMTTPMTKVRNLVISFEQSVKALLNVGDKVDTDTVLCILEDPTTGESGSFDRKAVQSLKALAAFSPKAKVLGTIERIEVVYRGNVDNMSKSLKAIVSEYDNLRKRQVNRLQTDDAKTGEIKNSFQIDGRTIDTDHVVIKIYITKDDPASVGDKFVFGSQMKTVVGRVMTGTNETLDGTPLDALFSFRSLSARVVNSPMIQGTTNKLLKLVGEKAYDIYKGNK